MNIKLLFLLIFMMLLGAGSGAMADVVYKWTDEQGDVHFSDRPQDGSQAIDMQVSPRYPSPSQPQSSAEGEKPQEGKDAQDGGRQQVVDAEKQREVRRKNCATARETLRRNKNLGRMYRIGADGERHYLSDKERNQVLERSRSDVEKWCG